MSRVVVQEMMKQETKAKLCWWAIAVCCGFLTLANLMLPLSTVHNRSRTAKRISDLASAGHQTVSSQELRAALVDAQTVWNRSHRFLNLNVYLPAIITILAIVGSQVVGKPKGHQTAQSAPRELTQ